MVALDTLAYVRHLESAGVPRAQAEAHAEAVASFAGDTLPTKRDLLEVEARLRAEDPRAGHPPQRADGPPGRGPQRPDGPVPGEGRMTIKLGGMLVAAVGLVAVLVKHF